MVAAVDGLKVVFDPALDAGGWPGPLVGREAVCGEAWLGPLGLIARLETELGLAGAATELQRAAALTHVLEKTEGFWSRSFTADPLATARRLLADRDLLAVWGWCGEPAGARLDALWTVTRDAHAGIPDRLQRILEVLPRRSVDIATISMFEPRDTLAPRWRQVLDALKARGVAFELRPLPEVRAAGDLAAARTGRFEPCGDHSLALLRPHAPLAAADEVAAALAACDRLDDIVIIGADDVLDAALRRHGLPRLGEHLGTPASAALVRLVLEAAFRPMDPADLHALVCANPGPVPGAIRWRLAAALARFPGRGSPPWREALDKGLAEIEGVRRSTVAERLAALLDPQVERDDVLSLEQLAARLSVLTTWARGRLADHPSLAGVIVYADQLVRLARLLGCTTLDRGTVRRLWDEVGAPPLRGHGAEAGLAAIGDPGALVGPARVAIWWRFTREDAPAAPRLRLSAVERDLLSRAGVTVPDPGALMAAEARRWRRPLSLTRDALVLVCPRTDASAEPAHPHPLWDELVAAMPEKRLVDRLIGSQVKLPACARRQSATLRPKLAASDLVRVSRALVLGAPASPSSIEQLLACSVAWALERSGRLHRGSSAAPEPPGPLLYGNVAHHVLARVFGDGALGPEDAVARARAVLAAELGMLAEVLLLPIHDRSRAELEHAVIETARELGRLLEKTGAAVRGVEIALEGKLGDLAVAGRADLVLATPDAVIDFKWGASTYRDKLEAGTALQLAAYAELARTGRKLPEVAYLSLRNQRLVAAAGCTKLDATMPGSHTVRDMLDGALAGIAERRQQLTAGELHAPSAIEDVDDEGLEGGVMRLAPRCGYCSLGTLCGKRGRA